MLAFALALVLQVQKGAQRIGSGRDLANLVIAAEWVHAHLEPDDRVASAMPGLLRLYAGREPAHRFPALAEIEAQQWPDILAECRTANIRYIVWHDELGAEHGPHYFDRWRLGRFNSLATPAILPGVTPVRFFPGHPNLVIVALEPTSSPPLQGGAGGG